jgi:hypothetical protein
MRVWRRGEQPKPQTPAQAVGAYKKAMMDEIIKAIRIIQSERKP